VAVAAAAATTSAGVAFTAGRPASGTGAGELRRVDLIDGGLEFLARRGEVLEELDFAIEMDDEGFVLVLAKDVVEEGAAAGEFLVEDAALAEAGVNKEADSEQEVGFPGEIADGLGFAVLFKKEVVLGEIVDEGVVFIADGNEKIDGADVDGDGSGLLGERIGEVMEVEEGKEVEDLFHRGIREDARIVLSKKWRGPK
jgi:hypothetical protein